MTSLLRALALPLLLATACAGTAYHFDDGDTPAWTRLEPGMADGRMHAVGAVAVTARPTVDHDLAVRDAKGQISSMISARVRSRSTDVTVSTSTASDNRGEETSVISHAVDVDSSVELEHVRIDQAFRDEITRTQYVLVSVDAARWASELSQDLERDAGALTEKAKDADDRMSRGDVLGALQLTNATLATTGRIKHADVVLGVLGPKTGARTTARDAVRAVTRSRDTVSSSTPVSLDVRCTHPDHAAELRASLSEFLAEQGFRVLRGGETPARKPLLVNAELGSEPRGEQRVAGRVEHRFSATGDLEVIQPNGQAFAALACALRPGRHTEQDTDPKHAETLAARLAAQKLSSCFRSKWRKTFGTR